MPDRGGSILVGVAIGIGISLAGLVVSAMLMMAYVGFVLVGAIGVAQALWVIPAYRHFRSRGEPETGKGILLIAGLVFLLNATCWGAVLGGLMRIGG
jgi:hypothetical protein